VLIAAAAVSDFKPRQAAAHKLKKHAPDTAAMALEANPDILADLARRKRPDQLLVGFALETEHLEQAAGDKLRAKSLDLIVANDAAALDADESAVTLLTPADKPESLAPLPKAAVAAHVVDRIVRLMRERA
jgi:phosphopantothenoylcysteine decarboxylase/phosphopantothenate--cysteine ligase